MAIINPDDPEPTITPFAVKGTLNAAVTDTAVAEGIQTYRVVARVSTNAPGNAVSMSFNGSIEARNV